MEIWKEIPGYKGYEVSNKGRVRSYWAGRGGLVEIPKISKIGKNLRGYSTVVIRKNRKCKSWLVHRLVLLAFVKSSNLQCNHINGIKDDNRLENLEYCNSSQNQSHAYRLGLRKLPTWNRNPRSKLTRDQAYKIKYIETGFQKDIAKKYGITQGQVGFIKRNESWVDL